MYETGHIALGIVFGVLVGRVIGEKPIVPMLALVSVVPDIDMFHPFGIEHGGPTHSLVLIILSSMPFLTIYGLKALPYLAATLSHPLLGDPPFGTLSLLWPLNIGKFGLGEMVMVNSNMHIVLEYLSLLTALILLAGTGELKPLFKPLKVNLLLIVPLFSLVATLLLKSKPTPPIPPSIVLLNVMLIITFSLSTGLALKSLMLEGRIKDC